MKKNIKVLIWLGIILTLFLWTIACEKSEQAVAEDPSEDTASSQENAIPVKVMQVIAEPFLEWIPSTGTIKPWHEATIMSQTSGQIKEVFLELGQFKRCDEVLVQVDDELKQYAYNQAHAQFINAEANYEKANKDLERNKQLYKNKSITEFEMENARLKERSAYASMISAKAAFDTARRQLEDTKIKSPIDGDIAQKIVDVGDTVSPGMPIATIIDIRKLRVLVGISSQEIPRIKQGQQVQIKVDTYPNLTFKGKVSFIGPQAELSSRTFPVEIKVDNTSDKKLKPGMIARTNILVGKEDNVVVIPQDSILELEGKKVVYIVKEDRAERREITVTKVFENQVCACKDLKPGELLVITGQENLVEGALVTIVQ